MVPPPIQLTPEQQKCLRRQQRRAIGHVAERIHYVLLFARGYPVSQIATLYLVDERTVVTWLERYHALGVGGLDDLPRSGRPRRAGAAAQAETLCCLDTPPESTGAERTTWTRRLLRRHLEERLGYALSFSSVTRLIARLDFVWRRPKLGLKPGEGADEAREANRAIIGTARAVYPDAPLQVWAIYLSGHLAICRSSGICLYPDTRHVTRNRLNIEVRTDPTKSGCRSCCTSAPSIPKEEEN